MTITSPRRVVLATPGLAARAAAERQDRSRRLMRRTCGGFAVVALLALLAWLLLGSSLLAVREVAVTGVSRLSAAQVRTVAGVQVGTPLARVDLAGVTVRVRSLSPVAEVRISRRWPHELRITVVERAAVAAVADGSRVLLLDATGTVIGPAAVLPRGLTRLRVPTPSGPATVAALGVLRGLPAPLRAQLAVVSAMTSDQVELLLRDGRRVVWGSPVAGAEKAAATLALLRLPGRTFDVSSPGVVTRR